MLHPLQIVTGCAMEDTCKTVSNMELYTRLNQVQKLDSLNKTTKKRHKQRIKEMQSFIRKLHMLT